METYKYVAKDGTGKQVKGEVEADSERAAAKLIVAQGYIPVDISLKDKGRLFFGNRLHVRTKDKVMYSRQLSTLVGAGLPLTQALRTVSTQTSNKDLKSISDKVLQSVENGNTLSDSFAEYPKIFNKVFINIIAAGETSGTLDKALERLADQQEKDAEIVSKVKGALTYPIIVLVVILGVIVFMLTTVLPQVERLYVDLKQELPFITSSMLSVSKFITSSWWIILIIIVGMVYGIRSYIKTDNGRVLDDRFKMRVPIFGKLFMKMYMARFTRTGQTLMSSGVPMLEMMKISGDAINNVVIKASLDKAAVKVKGGKALSFALENDPNFLPLVGQMINIGEESGSIDEMMGKAADFYEGELDRQIKTISTTIEPILMVVLAGVAGLMVGAILIPVYGLVGTSI